MPFSPDIQTNIFHISHLGLLLVLSGLEILTPCLRIQILCSDSFPKPSSHADYSSHADTAPFFQPMVMLLISFFSFHSL